MDKKDGGLKLIDLELKDASLKISWVNILRNEPSVMNLLNVQIGMEINEDLWRINMKPREVEEYFCKISLFWQDVLKAWLNLHYEENPQDPKNQFIWWNSHIKINQKAVI